MTDSITIKLHAERSSDAHAFNKNELIHQSEFRNVQKWILRDIEDAKAPLPERTSLDRNRRHNTITILGTRGSGKTSFLLSLLTWAKKERKDIEVLDIIDPTLIEEKGHIFLDVLAAIRERVEKVLYNSETEAENEFLDTRQSWRDAMDKLAHGLPHIDGVGGTLTESNWQDPEYIMQRGLRSVNAARNLEDNFREFISLGLEILGKKAFIIAFDDIDIDFKKGWPVLEMLRKYFVSQQVITLLSGDMRLYALAVRKKQWMNFGNDLIKNEGSTQDRDEYLRELVTETEGQYLQKVMKPSRRIHLTTLYEKLYRDSNTDIAVSIPTNDSAELLKLYDSIFKRYGIYNSYQAEIYIAYLLNSPLRMQIRFLEVNTIGGVIDSDSILDPFISDLYENRIDIAAISASPQRLNIAILDLLLRGRILSETNQLQPTTTNSSLNGALSALSLFFSKTSETNPDVIFDNLVRVGYLRNLHSSLGYQADNGDDRLNARPSIEGLCKHAGILQDRVIKDEIGMATAYMNAVREMDGDSDRPWAGMIPLRGLAGVSHMRTDLKKDRIDFVAGELDATRAALVYLPLSISQSSREQRGTVIYSFHTLLAAIAEFVRKAKNNDVFNGIWELSQLRSYPMPDFTLRGGTASDSFERNSPIELEQLTDNRRNEILENLLKNWYNSYENKAVPPHLLGKIATRFFFAADAIQNDQKNEKLGEVMHYLTVAFFNAVVIEDVREHVTRPNINLNNTRMSSYVLENNLRSTSAHENENLHLSRWVLSCPLLVPYLNPASRLRELIGDFGNDNLTEPAFQLSVYDALMRVSPKVRVTKPRGYESTINQLSKIVPDTFKFNESELPESRLAEIAELYQRSYPAEKMSVSKLRRMLDYFHLDDAD